MTFLQLVLNSLTLGSIYALVAIGLVLVYKASDLINFGAGDWVLAGGYISLALLLAGVPLLWVLVLAPLGGALMGVVIDRLVWRRMAGSSPWTFAIASLAVGGLLHELALLRYQSNHFSFPALFSREPIAIGELRVTPQNIWVVVATLVVVASLFAFFRWTRYGKALDAVAQNRTGAQLVGINLKQALMVTWALAGVVSTLAAILIAPAVDVSPEMGLLVVKGFVAAAVGGLDNLGGAVVGGLTVALVETMTTVYVSQVADDIVVFGLLLVIMYLKPSGLFGRRSAVRV